MPEQLKESVKRVQRQFASQTSPPSSQVATTASELIESATFDHTRSNPQLFLIIHSVPSYAECQKFSCSNLDEFNVMYHTWMFPNHQLGSEGPEDNATVSEDQLVDISEGSVSEKVTCGCFDPIGVRGVHLNLKDAGMPINEAKSDFSVVIYDISFSPSNLMLQVTHTHQICSFWSYAHKEPSKKSTPHGPQETSPSIVCLHLFPSSPQMDVALSSAISTSTNLLELASKITEIDVVVDEDSSNSPASISRASEQLTRFLRSIPFQELGNGE